MLIEQARVLEEERLAAIEEEKRLAALAEEERLAEIARLAALSEVINIVDTGVVIAGLTITPGGPHPIAPGATRDVGDVTFRCPTSGEVSCNVTVNDDGTVTSTGGAATATLSANGVVRLHTVREVEIELSPRYVKIPAGTKTLPPTGSMETGDVKIRCSANGVRCIIKVDDEGVVTSTGGLATIEGYSMEAIETRMAIALSASDGALVAQADPGETGAPVTIGVERRPNGVITITPAHSDDMDEVKYSKAVDTGYEITGWMKQTLKRDNGTEATEDVDAVLATEMDETTAYTNIDRAKAGKWKVSGEAVPGFDVMAFVVDADQEITNEDDATFTGAYIRMADGSRIPGTFTCDEDCETVTDPELSTEGNLLLANTLDQGWTFESKYDVKEGETPDADYMYFGYWMKSPVEHSADSTDYAFATFAGGNAAANMFTVGSRLTSLTKGTKATYVGGAAGRYVTRELRVTDGEVDANSPGSHGRFTAKATLTAYFGRMLSSWQTIPQTLIPQIDEIWSKEP